jgi:hypothetical protein
MTASDHAGPDSDRPAPGGCAIWMSVGRRFQGCGYAVPSRVYSELRRDSGTSHLRGTAPSDYLKRVAQELVRDHEGVLLVSNQIKFD